MSQIRRRHIGQDKIIENVLPPDYHREEYVSGPFTTKLVTSVNKLLGTWVLDVESGNTDSQMIISCQTTTGGGYAGVSGGKYWLGGGISSRTSCIGRQTLSVYFQINSIYLEVNGETVSRTGSAPNDTVELFSGNGGYRYTGKIYSVKCINDSAVLFDGVPVTRISDDKQGIYDFVSSTFYPKN